MNKTRLPTLAHDGTGGLGRLVVLLPSAGGLRSEYRLIVDDLASAGYRVVTADLPGHGESSPTSEYTVRSTAQAITELIQTLEAGPAVVIGASFTPAAAVWAAVDRPDLIDGLVAISPHFTADDSVKGRLQRLSINLLLRGPWAGALWARLYVGWFKTTRPADLEAEVVRLGEMLRHPARRRAVRLTLTAGREGVAERMAAFGRPTLIVFGSLDDHFADPVAEAESVAATLGGERLVVEGAGHYPHVEQPKLVTKRILNFLESMG